MKLMAWQFESEYHKVMTSFVQVFDSVNKPWFQFFEILKSKNCWFWCFERKNQNWRATGSGCFKHWKNLWFLWKTWQRTIGFWVVLCCCSSSLRMMVIYEDWFFVFFRTVVLIPRTSLITSGGLIVSFATCTTLVMTALSTVLPSKCLKVEIFLLSCRQVYIWLLDVLSGYSSSLIDEGWNMELGVCTKKAERPSSWSFHHAWWYNEQVGALFCRYN